MWRCKESEDDDEDIGMALAGFIFLPSEISKLKNKRFFLGVRPSLSKGNILTYSSLPYSGSDLLNLCPPKTAKDQRHCAETNLQVAKLATKQKSLIFTYRRLESLELQKCFMNVAELMEICRKMH